MQVLKLSINTKQYDDKQMKGERLVTGSQGHMYIENDFCKFIKIRTLI